MKIAYFDCFSGVSGDMILGSLIDCGVKQKDLLDTLQLLPIDFEILITNVVRSGIKSTQVKVVSKEKKILRSWKNIEKIFKDSRIDLDVKQKSLKILNLIVSVESKIHGVPINKIHLHEIGAVDTIVDILGAVQGLKLLEIDEIRCSPIATGNGVVLTEHGIMPIPAPATAEILKGIPVYGGSIQAELATPTGAAIIKSLCDNFGTVPEMKINDVGYGAGERDLGKHPNLLRLLVGETTTPVEEESKFNKENLLVVSANIDDLNPELYGNLIDQLLKAGAKDAWFYPISMKKGRQGICMNALIETKNRENVLDKLFRESSSLGARVTTVERNSVERKSVEVTVDGQNIKVKLGFIGSELVNVAPEYADCLKASEKTNEPLKEIYQKATIEALKKFTEE